MHITFKDAGSRLRIRTAPEGDPTGEFLHDGDTADIEGCELGWCELRGGGYVDARFVSVHDGAAPEAEQVTGAATEPPAEAVTGDPEPPAEPTDDGAAPEAEALQGMTIPKLIELADASGIKVNRKGTKDSIIAAILQGAND